MKRKKDLKFFWQFKWQWQNDFESDDVNLLLNISAICGLICRLLKVFEKTNYLEKSDSKNEIYHPTFFHISTQLKVVMRCQKNPSRDLTQINFNNHLRVTVHFFEKCHNFSTREVIKSNIHMIITFKKYRFLISWAYDYVWNCMITCLQKIKVNLVEPKNTYWEHIDNVIFNITYVYKMAI